MSMAFTRILVCLAGISLSQYAAAGGPLIVGGPDGATPVRFQDSQVTIHIENGNLGSISNADADQMVTEAFALWNDVSTATLSLQIDQQQLDFDIDINNFEDYLPSVNQTSFNDDDGLNPLVYDADGSIIDAYFGAGQSQFTIGFAASVSRSGNPYFSEGYAVINGRDLGLSQNVLKILITHEIAHFFGLDHTQTNISNQESDFGLPIICSSASSDEYAVMYPFICREALSLHVDDISALVALYPASDAGQQYAILQGRFVDEAGAPILGANIWAENISTGEAISVISDYLLQGNGFYKLYLPPGQYTLHANSVNTLFTGASGVGPYTASSSDISFQPPHPIGQVDYLGDSESDVATLTVDGGQQLDITFNSAGSRVSGAAGDTDDDDSIADLFGSSSPGTLLMIMTVVLLLRRARIGTDVMASRSRQY